VFFSGDVTPAIIIQQWIGGITPSALIAVPMFILAADVMTRGQAAGRLLDAVAAFVGHVRGALGYYTDKVIGNITINNTGDIEYNGYSNCTIGFDTDDYDGFTLDYYSVTSSDWPSSNRGLQLPATQNISAGNITTYNISASFPAASLSQSPIITVTSNINDTVDGKYNQTINVSMNINNPGPYLETTLNSLPTTIYLTTQNINFSGSLENIAGNETDTNTAFNVTFSWSLPSGFTVGSGNLSVNYTNISNTGKNYNNLNLTFDESNLESLSAGTVSVSVSAIGYNHTSKNNYSLGAIVHTDGETTVTSTQEISLQCYNVSDGVCVTSCGYLLDSDCEQEVVTTTVTTGGSGGGGSGGGGSGGGTIIYAKEIDIVRGEEDSFEIEVHNKYNNTLSNIQLSISGLEGLNLSLDKYLEITPSRIYEIGPYEKKSFKVRIKAPSYKEFEEQDLIANIRGKRVINNVEQDYSEKQNIRLLIQEISSEETNISLTEAEEAIQKMIDKGYNVKQAESILEQAKTRLGEKRNKESYDLTQEILSIQEQAEESKSLINNLLVVLLNPKKINLITGNVAKEIYAEELGKVKTNSILTGNAIFSSSSVEEMVSLADAAFNRGDYGLALERAQTAQVLLLLERKGNLGLFLYLYWHIVLVFFTIFLFVGTVGYRKYRKESIASRIKYLNKEEKGIRNLLIKNQKNYFARKIGPSYYNSNNTGYNEKLGKIKKERVRLRNKRIKVLEPGKILKDLRLETRSIQDYIASIQKDYYKNKNISESEYNLQFRLMNERLAEIEDERSTTELLVKKKKKYGGKYLKINLSDEQKKKHDKIKERESKKKEIERTEAKKLAKEIKEQAKDKKTKGKYIKININKKLKSKKKVSDNKKEVKKKK